VHQGIWHQPGAAWRKGRRATGSYLFARESVLPITWRAFFQLTAWGASRQASHASSALPQILTSSIGINGGISNGYRFRCGNFSGDTISCGFPLAVSSCAAYGSSLSVVRPSFRSCVTRVVGETAKACLLRRDVDSRNHQAALSGRWKAISWHRQRNPAARASISVNERSAEMVKKPV